MKRHTWGDLVRHVVTWLSLVLLVLIFYQAGQSASQNLEFLSQQLQPNTVQQFDLKKALHQKQ